MNISDPLLIDRLASGYVLGTLRGAARRRLEQLALETSRPELQSAIWRWERRLNVMASEVSPIQPPARLWHNIEQRLDGKPAVRSRSNRLWQLLAGGLAIAVMVLALPYLQPAKRPSPGSPIIEQLALIEGENEQPLWVITLDLAKGTLHSRAVNTPARDVDRVYQLWLLPGQGQPQSVGLLPLSAGARSENQLSPALVALLQGSQGLAVSIEPPGGSPTGLPTGPVVYTAKLLEL